MTAKKRLVPGTLVRLASDSIGVFIDDDTKIVRFLALTRADAWGKDKDGLAVFTSGIHDWRVIWEPRDGR